VVLGKCIGQFDEAFCPAAVHDNKREDSFDVISLRFKRISIKRRTIIFNVKLRNPIQIAEHGRRREAFYLPVMKISIDFRHSPVKFLSILKNTAIVGQAMKTDAKAIVNKSSPDLRRTVIAFRHKIKGRLKADFLFKLHQLETFFIALD